MGSESVSVLKFIVKAYQKQKLKFLLIFLMTFFTLLIFNISSSLKESVVNTRLDQLRDITENSQIIISAEDGSYKEFDEKIFYDLYNEDTCAYIDKQITRHYCYVEVKETKETLFLYGTDVKQQREIYDFQLESGNLDDWNEHDILISKEYAEQNHLKAGDTLTLQYGKKSETLVIKAISKSDGMFQNAYDFAITSQEFVDRIGERNGLVNRIDLTISDLKSMDEIASEMNEKLEGTGLAARAKYNLHYFNSYVTTVVLAMNLFSIFLLLLMIYMMYALFQSYVYENAGEMATLRSIGVSIRTYRRLLGLEAAFIVVLAFVCSMICTPLAIKLMGGIMFQQNTEVSLHMGVSVLKGMAVLAIAVASIYGASYKVSKVELVTLLRGEMNYQPRTFQKKRLVAAIAVMAAGAVCSFMNRRESTLVLNYVVLVSVLVSLLLLQEVFVRFYASLLEKLFSNKRKSIGLFGKQAKTALLSYLPAITMLVFVLSIAIAVLSMSKILDQAMEKMYSSADFYVTIQDKDAKQCLEVIDSCSEIESYVTEIQKNEVVLNSKITLMGLEKNIPDMNYKMVANCDSYKRFQELSKGCNVIISETLAKRWKKSEGDNITIRDKSFKITEVIQTFENMGDIAFISESAFYEIIDNFDTCVVLARASDKENLNEWKEKIQENLDQAGNATILTTEEMYKSNKRSNQIIIQGILGFTLLILLVSGVGLCSVVMINILLRQREFLIYQTIGISKASILKVSFYEAIAISVYGILNALLIQKILLSIMIEILSYYVGSLHIANSITSNIGLFVLVSVLTTTVMLGVTKKYALSDGVIEQIKVN